MFSFYSYGFYYQWRLLSLLARFSQYRYYVRGGGDIRCYSQQLVLLGALKVVNVNNLQLFLINQVFVVKYIVVNLLFLIFNIYSILYSVIVIYIQIVFRAIGVSIVSIVYLILIVISNISIQLVIEALLEIVTIIKVLVVMVISI